MHLVLEYLGETLTLRAYRNTVNLFVSNSLGDLKNVQIAESSN